MKHAKGIIWLALKIARLLFTIWIITSLIFLLFHLIPGDPVSMYFFNLERTRGYVPGYEKAVKAYKEMFGLDKDLFTQYVYFLRNVFLRGDFGPSIINFPESSKVLILRALPWSIGLLGTASVIAWSIGLILGVIAGWFKDSKFSSSITSLALFLSRIPFYYLGVIMLLIFGYTLNLFPTGGAYSPGVTPAFNLRFIADLIQHSFLPAISLIVVAASGRMISSRALVVSILGEDYLRFANAKGLKRGWILYKYVLRNALLPQITDLGITLGFTVNGSVLIETIFNYPGVGYLFMTAISLLDFNTICGILFITSTVVIITMFIMELIYPLIDPRVRSSI